MKKLWMHNILKIVKLYIKNITKRSKQNHEKKTPLDSKILEIGIVQPLCQNSLCNPVDSFFDCNGHLGRGLHGLCMVRDGSNPPRLSRVKKESIMKIFLCVILGIILAGCSDSPQTTRRKSEDRKYTLTVDRCKYNNDEAYNETYNLYYCIKENGEEDSNIEFLSVEIPWDSVPWYAKVTTMDHIYYLSRDNYRNQWRIIEIWDVSCSFWFKAPVSKAAGSHKIKIIFAVVAIIVLLAVSGYPFLRYYRRKRKFAASCQSKLRQISAASKQYRQKDLYALYLELFMDSNKRYFFIDDLRKVSGKSAAARRFQIAVAAADAAQAQKRPLSRTEFDQINDFAIYSDADGQLLIFSKYSRLIHVESVPDCNAL